MKTGTYYEIKKTLKVHRNRKYTGGCHGLGGGETKNCYFVGRVSVLYEIVPEMGSKATYLKHNQLLISDKVDF